VDGRRHDLCFTPPQVGAGLAWAGIMPYVMSMIDS
jgi:hypothetical protein